MEQTTLQKLIDDMEVIKSRGMELTMSVVINLLSNSLEAEKKMLCATWDDGYEKGTRSRMEKISNPVFDFDHYYQEKFKSE